ncbi:MAG: biotin--[acetyl-CoA-carboxylase] ligase [Deltaproteobacteria bacterium]|nr:biotin--[acetyl-CoA-carboxylase] ligase [Deltaproteobacteria bacterium]
MDSELLQALREGGHISGEELGRRLNVTRTAIWKRINRLRGLGYEITSSPRRGYSFMSAPDLLLSEEIEPGLRTKIFGRPIIFYSELSSTQDTAKELARKGAKEGTVVIAENQTQGKGRKGREWSSASGQGIQISVILRPRLRPSQSIQIPLVAGVAMAQAIIEVTPLKPRIKWPNDLMIGGKKVGGILTEMNAEIDRIDYVVLGVGLNVNTPQSLFPKEIRRIATSLAEELGGPVSRVRLVQSFLTEFEGLYEEFTTSGFQTIRERWKAMSDTIGAWVELSDMGEGKMKGRVLDMDMEGALLLEKEDQSIERILAGDISLRESSVVTQKELTS